MLTDRGYINVNLNPDMIGSDIFCREEKVTVQMFIFVTFAVSRGINIHTGLNKKEIDGIMRKFILYAHESPARGVILIVPDGLVGRMESMVADYMEVHSESSLMYDPTCNINYLKHTLADEKDVTWSQEDLPRIRRSDPIVRWYGFKKGDIIRIERTYSGEVYYRTVY
jgi:DNA-directed RNA polymerase subunit H (RpoH/RPB5)